MKLKSDAQQAADFVRKLAEINLFLSASEGLDRVYLIMDDRGEELRYSAPDAMVAATQVPLDLNAWVAD